MLGLTKMPVTRNRRSSAVSRRSPRPQQSTMFLNHAVVNSLSVQQLRELCRTRGISATGVRETLLHRLAPLTERPVEPTTGSQPSEPASAATDQSRLSAGQMDQIKQLVMDTVREASRDIASEAARAAITAIRGATDTPTQTHDVPNSEIPTDIVGQTGTLASVLQVGDQTQTSYTSLGSTPNQELPASYVREIQTGEFFDLSKLLPKNLNAFQNDDDNLTLSLDNSVIKVTKKKKLASTITEIEQWTTAFTSYMSVFTSKYPLRAQEFLQYLSLVRYAARVHKGLGWAIYDHKFRQKAAIDKSLVWSTIDQHLWLTIFTVAPSVLQEEYPLFTQGPQGSVSSEGVKGTCHRFNRKGSCDKQFCNFKHLCQKCNGPHPLQDCGIYPPTSRYRDEERVRDRERAHRGSKSGHSSSSK